MAPTAHGPADGLDHALTSLPAAFTWRPLTADDVPAWLVLREAADDADDAEERASAGELAGLLEGSWRDPALDTLGGFDADGAMVAYARSEYQPVTGGPQAPELFGAVHPAHRRQGLGQAVLAWSEARGRAQVRAAGGDLAQLSLSAPTHHAGLRVLAESAGYTPRRWYVNMRRDLSVDLPVVEPAAGIAIEPYPPERDDEVRRTHNEAFVVDHWGSNPMDAETWARRVTGNDAFRADWSVVAVDHTELSRDPEAGGGESGRGRIVGYLMSGAYEQDWAPQGYTEGWTDLLAVRREYRGCGVAAALLTAAMAAYRESGIEHAGLEVDTENPSSAFTLYERLGYVRERGSVLFAKDVAANHV